MKSSPVLGFENVSKCYRLGAGRRSLREALTAPLARLGKPGREGWREDNLLWALKDVSFEVEQGEVLGIIGPNGAGKTTALKLLSRVTRPTSGQVNIGGRISSLIELGAGFHPELTGRENIYLNGVILGLKRREIDALFDRIVAFAELERFINTPVKRYSSGMYCRLGFSVAAHVRPDILLVDEVLAVGDMAFQAKCVERMRDLRARGTTIVFVSHNLLAVNGLCTKGLLLHEGRIRYRGSVEQAIQSYQRLVNEMAAQNIEMQLAGRGSTSPNAVGKLSADLLDSEGASRREYELGETFVARIHYQVHRRIERPVFNAGIIRADGLNACSNNSLGQLELVAIEGAGVVELTVPALMVTPGTYTLVGLIWDHEMIRPYVFEPLATFSVISSHRHIDENYGVFVPDFRWRALDDTAANCHGERLRSSGDAQS